MPRTVFTLLVSLFLSVVEAGSAFAQEGRKYALLVGVQKYDGTGLNNLKYAEKDITVLGETLTSLGYKVTMVTRNEYKKTDKDFLEPTAQNITAQLKAVCKERSPKDTVLVAFSGHGVHLKSTNKFYYCPAKCDLDKPETMVTVDEVMATLGNCSAGSKVLLVDACRNDPTDGKAGTDVRLGSKTRPLIAKPTGGSVALFSCKTGQISHESEKFGHGFMMHFVIEGLKGKAADAKSGTISWDQLVAHVKLEVREAVTAEKGPNAEQFPESLGAADILTLGNVTTAVASVPAPKPGEERSFEIANGMKMIFCYIPAGKDVQLGSPKAERVSVMKTRGHQKEDDDDKRQAEEHRGKFSTNGFWLAKFSVTQEEWIAIMGSNPSYFCKTGGGKDKVAGQDTSRFPVENVSWNDCQDFLVKLNAKGGATKVFGRAGKFWLPHEDQWEYACRGGRGNQQAYYWGSSLNGDNANCCGEAPFGTTKEGPFLKRTTAVGSYEQVAPHPWGLCDMSGNVEQWCDNQYEFFITRVLRGGSWSSGAWDCRSALRYKERPEEKNKYFGFRLMFPLE